MSPQQRALYDRPCKILDMVKKYGVHAFVVNAILITLACALRLIMESQLVVKMDIGYFLSVEDINSLQFQFWLLDYLIRVLFILLLVSVPIALYSIAYHSDETMEIL